MQNNSNTKQNEEINKKPKGNSKESWATEGPPPLRPAQSLLYDGDMSILDKCGRTGDQSASYRTRWLEYGHGVYKRVHTRKTKMQERKPQEARDSKEKLLHNVRRSISTVEGLALANPWEWWVTLTLDQAKQDRYNIAEYKKSLAQWLRDQRKRNKNLKYLLIPEQHKDGAWHMHGLIMGIPESTLSREWPIGPLPQYIQERKETLLYWPAYQARYGWCTIEEIRNLRACAAYCAKYMAKGLESAAIQKGKALYLASQGLARPVEIEAAEVPQEAILTSGYQWQTGAAYWYELREKPYKGKILDMTTGEVLEW